MLSLLIEIENIEFNKQMFKSSDVSARIFIVPFTQFFC